MLLQVISQCPLLKLKTQITFGKVLHFDISSYQFSDISSLRHMENLIRVNLLKTIFFC